jgi:hypothetical protein
MHIIIQVLLKILHFLGYRSEKKKIYVVGYDIGDVSAQS